MARHDSSDASTIDAMLRGLTSRPNVQSTLILSRKDGSIIKAAGSISPDEQRKSDRRPYQRSSSAEGTDNTPDAMAQTSSATEESNYHSEEKHSPELEVLARAVYQFVGAAGVLGRSLNAFDDATDNSTVRNSQEENNEQGEKSQSASTGHNDSEVQLLRMRVKRQEVIIFPDPNYLCCVVQSMERAPK